MEIARFGLNAVTVSFVGTIVFSVIMSWGFWRQARAIWRERSGRSLSAPSFLYATFVRIPILVYGLSIGSLALLVNGTVPFFPLLLIVLGLRKYKGFGRREWLLVAALSAAVALTAVLPDKGAVFMSWMFGSVAFNALQPLEMWRRRSAGVVEIRMLLMGLASNTFWLVYAFAIGDWLLEVINPAFSAINITSLILWLVFRRRKRGTETKTT